MKAATASHRGQMGGFALTALRYRVMAHGAVVAGTVVLATLGRRRRRGRSGLGMPSERDGQDFVLPMALLEKAILS